ncbi:MAG: helix-turn-helix domain-containing protein [Burkholderiaceae bacterium]|nr:helix-turn-helix domain-containing protein [Burkholderiaceae bacterium]
MAKLQPDSVAAGPSRHDGAVDSAQSRAVKEAIALQIAAAMKDQSLSKARMAALLNTSRSQVDRLLDSASDVTLSTLQRAAALVGRRIQIELVE